VAGVSAEFSATDFVFSSKEGDFNKPEREKNTDMTAGLKCQIALLNKK
jgi:hypothetical protein